MHYGKIIICPIPYFCYQGNPKFIIFVHYYRNTMNRKCILLFSLIILLSHLSFGQESQKKKGHEFWHRLSVGGNLGLQFGTVTAINISPEVMLRVVDQFHLGVGFSYDYLQSKKYFWDDPNQQYLDFKANVYGGRVFARYYLRSLFDNFVGNLFAHAEYEYLYYTRPFKLDPSGTIYDPFGYTYNRRKDFLEINSLFVGVGYEQPFTERAFMDILILYNINDTYTSPYSNPVFRLGFGFRL